MEKAILISVLLALMVSPSISGSAAAYPRSGYILLQVERNGEAWYVYPQTGNRHYLGRPADAFNVMRKLALGAKHDFIAGTEIFPDRLKGLILLDVEKNGEAYYIYPKDKKKYYLGRPADAFNVMRELGQGISDAGLAAIPVHQDAQDPSTAMIIQDVPFTPQAPFGDWSDQRQEDGCEEASALMAVRWAQNKGLALEDALKEITGISDHLQDRYGEYRDISSTDTLNWIIKGYFGHEKAAEKKDVAVEDIIAELKKGNIIIAPMNGQTLKNPYYTQPGPIHHMLVVTGYDPVKKVFITNDPGTKRGEDYAYDVDIFYGSIRDYPTGYHEILAKTEKNIITIWK